MSLRGTKDRSLGRINDIQGGSHDKGKVENTLGKKPARTWLIFVFNTRGGSTLSFCCAPDLPDHKTNNPTRCLGWCIAFGCANRACAWAILGPTVSSHSVETSNPVLACAQFSHRLFFLRFVCHCAARQLLLHGKPSERIQRTN